MRTIRELARVHILLELGEQPAQLVGAHIRQPEEPDAGRIDHADLAAPELFGVVDEVHLARRGCVPTTLIDIADCSRLDPQSRIQRIGKRALPDARVPHEGAGLPREQSAQLIDTRRRIITRGRGTHRDRDPRVAVRVELLECLGQLICIDEVRLVHRDDRVALAPLHRDEIPIDQTRMQRRRRHRDHDHHHIDIRRDDAFLARVVRIGSRELGGSRQHIDHLRLLLFARQIQRHHAHAIPHRDRGLLTTRHLRAQSAQDRLVLTIEQHRGASTREPDDQALCELLFLCVLVTRAFVRVFLVHQTQHPIDQRVRAALAAPHPLAVDGLTRFRSPTLLRLRSRPAGVLVQPILLVFGQRLQDPFQLGSLVLVQ